MPILALAAFVLSVINIPLDAVVKTLLIILCFGIVAGGAVYRYTTTWKMQTISFSSMPIQTSGATDLLGCLLTAVFSLMLNMLVITILPVIIAVVTWPFLEISRQSRFLADAWKSWGAGQVLVGPDGQLVHADANLNYRPEAKQDTIALTDTNSS
jgi:hypothetical protein